MVLANPICTVLHMVLANPICTGCAPYVYGSGQPYAHLIPVYSTHRHSPTHMHHTTTPPLSFIPPDIALTSTPHTLMCTHRYTPEHMQCIAAVFGPISPDTVLTSTSHTIMCTHRYTPVHMQCIAVVFGPVSPDIARTNALHTPYYLYFFCYERTGTRLSTCTALPLCLDPSPLKIRVWWPFKLGRAQVRNECGG